jgi:altronate dehydratase
MTWFQGTRGIEPLVSGHGQSLHPSPLIVRFIQKLPQMNIPGEMVANTLIGVGEDPNAAATLVVGIGCEEMPAHALAKRIKQSGKPVEWISIEDLGEIVRRSLKVKKFSTQWLRKSKDRNRESSTWTNSPLA